jgi:hypothetical protein
MNDRTLGSWVVFPLVHILITAFLLGSASAFDFRNELFQPPSTLSAAVESLDVGSGQVTINGGDSASPSTPFDIEWGDGTPPQSGWFPFGHIYADQARNYAATVTAHYDGDQTASVPVPVRFVAPILAPVDLPAELAVTIDSGPLSLLPRLYPGYTPPALSYFDESFFEIVPRWAVEYVLSVAALLQHSFANGDVLSVSSAFQQHVLRDSGFGGMYSIWYSDPVAFGAGDYAFTGQIEYSSFFHEMGHNVTLNSPAAFHYGGRIDGNANAIYSETMAQIFQHSTAYTLLNRTGEYGIEATLATEIEKSARASMELVHSAYTEYITSGYPFASWNDPSTPGDETFNTFMTLAYTFFAHAENAGQGYEEPLQRMMRLLQLFDPTMATQYAQTSNTPEADTFRSTLMVAALSYAFVTDLRTEMRLLAFPVDDGIFQDLVDRAHARDQGFYTVTPCRVVDTRDADGPLGGPILAGNGAERSFVVTGSCGIPADATAISVNVTVTMSTDYGLLRVYPGNLAAPVVSTINFTAGRTLANNAILRLPDNGSGSITVKADGPAQVHFLLDVNGYFK